MSLRLNVAATRTYDYLKSRPGAQQRRSDARDLGTLEEIGERLRLLISEYRINGHTAPGGGVYVFWYDVQREIEAGAFDDLLGRL